jgi:tetratricopeptide (TPR) repeat protein
VYWLLGRRDLAEQARRQVVALRAGLYEIFPGNPARQADLAASLAALGNLYRDLGRLPRAEQVQRLALTLRVRLVRAHPAVPGYLASLADSLNDLGVLYRGLGRTAQAESAYRHSLTLRERLLRVFPTDRAQGDGLCMTATNLGVLLEEAGKLAEAVTWFDRTLGQLEALHRAGEDGARVRSRLEAMLWRHANLLNRLNRPAEAVRACDRALPLADAALAARIRLFRASAIARTGDHVRALAEARAAAGQSPPGNSALINRACVHAQCAAAIGRDGRLTPAERAEQGGRCAARAVALLEKIRLAGYFKDPNALDNLRTDADLDPLRGRADFQQLVQEVEKEAAGKTHLGDDLPRK